MPGYAASLKVGRSGNGHLGALVRQLDELLYASFVASYILDANFLNFIIRCISQLQFSSPKEHHAERSLKFHITAAFILNLLNCIYHITVPLAWDPRGITIDFIGQSYLPSKLQLFSIDIITAFLQFFMIILTYETSHYGSEADLDDSLPPDMEEEENESLLPSEAATPDETSSGEEDNEAFAPSMTRDADRPILDLRLQQTLHRIMHDKPLSIVNQDTPAAGEETAASLSPSVARLQRLQQARTRSRRRRTGQTASADNGRQSPEGGRLDVGSDEEREVGMARDDRVYSL